MEALEVKNMTVFEARECVKKINENIQNTRVLLLELYEREGWRALGYTSWRSCVVAEFKDKENYLYKQLAAAKTERNICTAVQKEPIPERVLRPLTSLPPEEQKELFQQAVETAPEGKVTARHIEKTIQEYKHTETYPVTDALYFAGIAITQLEKIRKDDPKRQEAIQKVADWCNTNI